MGRISLKKSLLAARELLIDSDRKEAKMVVIIGGFKGISPTVSELKSPWGYQKFLSRFKRREALSSGQFS